MGTVVTRGSGGGLWPAVGLGLWVMLIFGFAGDCGELWVFVGYRCFLGDYWVFPGAG